MNRQMAMAGLVLLGGCSPSTNNSTQAPEPVALVTLAQVETGAIVQATTLYGAVESDASGKYVLSAPVEAIVGSIDAPVGTAVRPGQIVARLSPSPTARLDLVKASADARAAEQAYARATRLHADGLVGNAEVETARAAAQSAGAARASLSMRNGSLLLRAPRSGYVDSVTPSPGDLVAAGTAVATIAKLGDLRARFGVDPAIARGLRPGASLRIATSDGIPFTVPALSIDPVVDPLTRLASVFARIPANAGIGAGETLTAQVAVSAAIDGLTIPYAALLDDGGQPYVFVAAGGGAHRRDVTTGASNGDRITIAKGLKAGDLVVTEGGTALDDGMKVRTK